jgi:cytoskeletal protein RodZ
MTLTSFDTPPHIGEILRDRRHELDLSLADVHEGTHLRLEFLRAIEGLDVERLPSVGYVLGYVRCYANYLGLDGAEAVTRFKEDTAVPLKVVMRDSPHFVPEHRLRLPRGIIPALGVIGFAVMLSVWYGGNNTSVASEPTVPTVASLSGTVSESQAVDPNSITLVATAPSWMQVKNKAGKTVISRIFVTGERYTAFKNSGYTVSVRDAGAISIRVGGQDYGALGVTGEQLRDIPLYSPAFAGFQ